MSKYLVIFLFFLANICFAESKSNANEVFSGLKREVDEARMMYEGVRSSPRVDVVERLRAANFLVQRLLDTGRIEEATDINLDVFDVMSAFKNEPDNFRGIRTNQQRYAEFLYAKYNQGRIYQATGRDAEALQVYDHVLRQLENTYWEKTDPLKGDLGLEQQCRLLTSLAALLNRLEQPRRAIAHAKKAYSIASGLNPAKSSVLIANAAAHLAEAYGEIGNFREAETLIEKAAVLVLNSYGNKHPYSIRIQAIRSRVIFEMGRWEKSKWFEAHGLKGARATSPFNPPDGPGILQDRMDIATQLDDLPNRTQAALSMALGVVRASDQFFGRTNIESISNLGLLIDLTIASGKFKDAAEQADDFIVRVEELRDAVGLFNPERKSILRLFSAQYSKFSALNGLLDRNIRGLELSELSKARVMLDNFGFQALLNANTLNNSDAKRMSQFALDFEGLENRIAAEQGIDAKLYLAAEQATLQKHFKIFQSDLQVKYPTYKDLISPRIVEDKNLGRLVPKNGILVSFVIHGNVRERHERDWEKSPKGDFVGAWILDYRGLAEFVPIGLIPHLSNAIEAFRLLSSWEGGAQDLYRFEGKSIWKMHDGTYRIAEGPISDAGPIRYEQLGGTWLKRVSTPSDVSELSMLLSKSILEPLAFMLREKSEWIIVPDGALAQLPIELLSLRGRRVIESHQVHYAHSISVLAESKKRLISYTERQWKEDLLAVGNPNYSVQGAASTVTKGARALRRFGRRNMGVFGNNISQLVVLDNSSPDLKRPGGAYIGGWTQLPGSETEVKSVAAMFSKSATLLAANASEARLQEMNADGALVNFRYILFSTHAFLDLSDPLLSSIVLSLDNITPLADGYITAREWAGYNLRTDLVVLSGCETGLGKVLNGEGLIGLTYALHVAGSVNTLLTLWEVDDEATALFIKLFFERVKSGQSLSQALTFAKRYFARHEKFSHPSFWAPFTLVGAG